MITAHSDAPAGAVSRLISYAASDFVAGSAILCRNNAPLVAFAFNLIHRDVPVRILGRELGQGLTKIVKSFKLDADYASWQDKLKSWHDREERKSKKPAQRDALDDKYNCLFVLFRSSDSVGQLLSRIETLFVGEESASAVTLATGHKAKGREWDHVFILDSFLIPSKWAEAQWELLQERNLLYVMVTRARLSLTYIRSGNWKLK